MNPALEFHDLVEAIRFDPTGQRVDVLASNLAAYVGREGRACVALVRGVGCNEAMYGAFELLRDYGLRAKLMRRNGGDHLLLLDPAEPDPIPHQGAEWRAVVAPGPLATLLDDARRANVAGREAAEAGEGVDFEVVVSPYTNDGAIWSAWLTRGSLSIRGARAQTPFGAIDALAGRPS